MLRRTLVGASAAAFAVVAVASMPALAADRNVTVDCHSDAIVRANPGDHVIIVMGSGCVVDSDWMANYAEIGYSRNGSGFLNWVAFNTAPDDGYSGVDIEPNGWWVYQNSTEDQTVTTTLATHNGLDDPLEVGSLLMTVNGSYGIYYAGAASEDASEGTPIADVTQQVGAPAGGCDAVADPSLNWGGVKSGGWTSSWAQWANDGKGGSVCTRTLHYDNGWIVTTA